MNAINRNRGALFLAFAVLLGAGCAVPEPAVDVEDDDAVSLTAQRQSLEATANSLAKNVAKERARAVAARERALWQARGGADEASTRLAVAVAREHEMLATSIQAALRTAYASVPTADRESIATLRHFKDESSVRRAFVTSVLDAHRGAFENIRGACAREASDARSSVVRDKLLAKVAKREALVELVASAIDSEDAEVRRAAKRAFQRLLPRGLAHEAVAVKR